MDCNSCINLSICKDLNSCVLLKVNASFINYKKRKQIIHRIKTLPVCNRSKTINVVINDIIKNNIIYRTWNGKITLLHLEKIFVINKNI